MDDQVQHQQDQQYHPSPTTCLPEDIAEQILRFLPLDQILRCSRTSRVFSRASHACLQGATWAPDPAGHSHFCRSPGRNDIHIDSLLGTPCLDLRAARDAVDCRALLALLRKAFSSKAEESASAVGGDDGDVRPAETTSSGRSTATHRKPPVLKGLALSSAAVHDQAISQTLELHGEDLQVLDLAGCLGLDTSSTVAAVRQRCKHLITLDLSGGGSFEGGGRGAIGFAPSQEKARHLLRDFHLTSLLPRVGGGLLSLRLRDRPFMTDDGISAIAAACTQLRELDIGQWSRSDGDRLVRTGNVTGQALATLSAAPCAPLLVSLGLRNQPSIGNLDLRALGTQFPSLRRLDLAGLAKVDDEVLKALAPTLSLTHIDLSRARHVSVGGVSALALGSPELECISLHGTALADEAIRALCDACAKLRHINVSMTRVTERSVHLLALKDSVRWMNFRCCCGVRDDDFTAQILADFRTRLLASKHPRDRGTVLGMEHPEAQLRTRPPNRSLRRPLSAMSSSGGGGHVGPPDDRRKGSSYHGQAAHALRPSTAASQGLQPMEPRYFGGGSGGTRDTPSGSSNTNSSTLRSDVPLDSKGGDLSVVQEVRAPPSREGGFSSEIGIVGAVTGNVQQVEDTAPRPWCVEPSGGSGGGGKPFPAKFAAAAAAAAAERTTGESSQGPFLSPVSFSSSSRPLTLVGRRADEGEGRRRAAIRGRGSGDAPAVGASAVGAPSTTSEAAMRASAAESPSVSGDNPLPLIPAGVGDLSLGQHRRRGRAQQRHQPSGQSSSSKAGELGRGSVGIGSRDGGHGSVGGGVDRECRTEKRMVPFDWDTVPRGSGVGVLGSWKGFRGLSGDLVKNVIRELHPHALVCFRPKSDSLLGPPSRKSNHGYLVHASKFGQAWVGFEVDDQGCVT